MAEERSRKLQYSYAEMSNRVIKERIKLEDQQFTGEAQSLKDKVKPEQLGDRVAFQKPPKEILEQKQKDQKSQKQKESETYIQKQQQIIMSKQNQQIYDKILNIVAQKVGDRPQDEIYGLTDEVISCAQINRNKDIELLLGQLNPEELNDVIVFSQQIPAQNQEVESENQKTQENINVQIDRGNIQSITDEHQHEIIDVQDTENSDMQDIQHLMPQIEEILKLSNRIAENKLIQLLGPDKINIVQKLMLQKINRNQEQQEQKQGNVFESFQFGAQLDFKQIMLPKGYETIQELGYQMIKIPAPEQLPSEIQNNIIKITELPEFAQPAFENFKHLNLIQSTVLESALFTDKNMLVCAPTGAGKTNIALLCLLQAYNQYQNKFQAVYIAPMKALVSEICGNLQNKLKNYNLIIREITGDVNLTKYELRETNILISTPEKWDVITRKINPGQLGDIKLVIFDEIHLLHDTRGPVLEALVVRLKPYCRLVGLSATLPNYEDIASFLKVESQHLYFFDKQYRPVPLEMTFAGITERKAVKRIVLYNEITFKLATEDLANQSQVLVFVHSRKETLNTAKSLIQIAKKQNFQFLPQDQRSFVLLQKEAKNIELKELQELLPQGIGIHHAGLSRNDRRLVEELFADKHLKILVSTATLAWGVNLPAAKVIIKGTQIYSPEECK